MILGSQSMVFFTGPLSEGTFLVGKFWREFIENTTQKTSFSRQSVRRLALSENALEEVKSNHADFLKKILINFKNIYSNLEMNLVLFNGILSKAL